MYPLEYLQQGWCQGDYENGSMVCFAGAVYKSRREGTISAVQSKAILNWADDQVISMVWLNNEPDNNQEGDCVTGWNDAQTDREPVLRLMAQAQEELLGIKAPEYADSHEDARAGAPVGQAT